MLNYMLNYVVGGFAITVDLDTVQTSFRISRRKGVTFLAAVATARGTHDKEWEVAEEEIRMGEHGACDTTEAQRTVSRRLSAVLEGVRAEARHRALVLGVLPPSNMRISSRRYKSRLREKARLDADRVPPAY